MDDLTLTPNHPAESPLIGHESRRVLADLEDYWRDLSRARRIPFRSEVNPARIDIALPHSFIVQRVAQGTGRVRVAGSRVEQVLGMDPRGMPLTAFFTPPGRVTVQRWFAEVFDRPAIVELPLISARGLGRPKLTGAMILLPLAAEDGSVSMALGALVTEGEPGRSPRRFDVPDGQIRISGVEATVGAAPRPPQGLTGRAQDIVDGLAPLAARDPVESRASRPYLRLVVDNG